MDDRVSQHEELIENIRKAVEENNKREIEVDRISEKADSMIRGATTAGLGDSLEVARALYGKRMLWSGVGFFFSIALLAASAVPLIAHFLPGLFDGWLAPLSASVDKVSSIESFFSLIGKIFLMFPATWLTQFFSKAYSEFFHLEREYAHKAALARSVEGFKRQAPNYKEEITTAVFFEVQANPSKQSSPEAAEHPIAGPLMKKFVESLSFGKSRGDG